jgi:serine/threonine protein kinase
VRNLSATQFGDLPGAAPVYTQTDFGHAASALVPNLLKVGSVLANRYEIRERIGAGGMGAVYRAFDRTRSEELAIKVLLPHLLSNPQARERFLTEAKLASKLSHPNIVNVFDVQRDGEHDFLTMELLKGTTLRDLMNARRQARRPFEIDEAIQIGATIGDALNHAH